MAGIETLQRWRRHRRDAPAPGLRHERLTFESMGPRGPFGNRHDPELRHCPLSHVNTTAPVTRTNRSLRNHAFSARHIPQLVTLASYCSDHLLVLLLYPFYLQHLPLLLLLKAAGGQSRAIHQSTHLQSSRHQASDYGSRGRSSPSPTATCCRL